MTVGRFFEVHLHRSCRLLFSIIQERAGRAKKLCCADRNSRSGKAEIAKHGKPRQSQLSIAAIPLDKTLTRLIESAIEWRSCQ